MIRSEYPQSDSGFPLTVGSLTFVSDAPPRNKKPMAVYLCACGKETKRDRTSSRTAKSRGIKSACKTCGRAKNKRTLQEAILLGIKERGAA
jgi:hypothetical protein